jgi:3'-phosphoadenosine 5'-phosphosulfate sulfotransferase (PAPS reductase)/FAD synthetase
MANPLNAQAIEDLEDATGCDIQVFVATPSDIRQVIKRLFQPDKIEKESEKSK